jgi:hypothetical protein
MAGKKECYAAMTVKKSAMPHKWYKRALCCRAGEKERYTAVLVKNSALLHGW